MNIALARTRKNIQPSKACEPSGSVAVLAATQAIEPVYRMLISPRRPYITARTARRGVPQKTPDIRTIPKKILAI
jgi:hypothetical protein